MVWTGRDQTRKQTLTGLQSGPETRRGGCDYNYRGIWALASLAFAAFHEQLRAAKAPASSAINLGLFQVEIKPCLDDCYSSQRLRLVRHGVSYSESNSYLTHLKPLKQAIKLQNHSWKKAERCTRTERGDTRDTKDGWFPRFQHQQRGK